MRQRRDVSAGVVVFHRGPDGCKFLLLRSKQTRRPLWEFPKGGVHRGETREQAALRELGEETGLGPEDIRWVRPFEFTEDYRFTTGPDEERMLIRKQVTYYLAEALRTDITISPEEATRFAWLDFDEARRKLRYAGRRTMLEAAAEAAGCARVQRDTSSRSREASSPRGKRRA